MLTCMLIQAFSCLATDDITSRRSNPLAGATDEGLKGESVPKVYFGIALCVERLCNDAVLVALVPCSGIPGSVYSNPGAKFRALDCSRSTL